MRHVLLAALLIGGCHAPEEVAHAPASHVTHPVAEDSLPVVHLTPEAVRRLAITTTRVIARDAAAVRLVGGDVIVPPGRVLMLTAPTGGVVRTGGRALVSPGTVVRRGDVLLRLVPLAPIDRDIRARTAREVAVAEAQRDATAARLARMEQLLAERAGSQRAYEEALAARDVASAELVAAEARARTTQQSPLLADVAMTLRAPADGVVRTLSVASEQTVAAGAPLIEIVAVAALEVRVPVYAGDLTRLDESAPADVRSLAQGATSVLATPVAGPPTSAPDQATVDRYFVLTDGAAFAPGERVLVSLRLREHEAARAMPMASIVYDAEGGAWTYACRDATSFTRVRVDPLRRDGDTLLFLRGPEVGACVVHVGATELFGAEFPPGH